MKTITVTNVTRRRQFGFGYTAQPTGRGIEIATPDAPDYVGTLAQVRSDMATDGFLRSLRNSGTYYNTSWFYQGKRITGVQSGDAWLSMPEAISDGYFDRDSYAYSETVTLRVAE